MEQRKLIVLGLDGADWKILEPLMAEGALPNLKRMMDGGSHARLQSTCPPLTAPSWTTIFTGVNPGKHGIYDFWFLGKGGIHHNTSRDIQVPYLWEIMAGRKIIAFNIPFMYPPRGGLNSAVVSGFNTPSAASQFTLPKELREEILSMAPDYDFSIGKAGKLLQAGASSDMSSLNNIIMRNLANKKKVAKHLLSTRPWELAIVVFSATDWAQHFFMHEFLNAEKKSPTMVGMVYSSIDSFVAEFLANDYDVIVVSDHGFREVRRHLYLNEYLKRQGHLVLKADPPIRRISRALGITAERVMPFLPHSIIEFFWYNKAAAKLAKSLVPIRMSVFDNIDYEKSMVLLGNCNGSIYLQKDFPLGKATEILGGCRDAAGRPAFTRILTKKESYGENAIGMPPSLNVTPQEDIFLKIEVGGPVWEEIDPKREKNGGHAEFGVFMAYGNGFMAKGRMQDLAVAGITPTVLAYFGHPVPSYMDGTPIGILKKMPPAAMLSLKEKTRLSAKIVAARVASAAASQVKH